MTLLCHKLVHLSLKLHNFGRKDQNLFFGHHQSSGMMIPLVGKLQGSNMLTVNVPITQDFPITQ